MMRMMLISDLFLSTSAVIVGCLPPFNSLFKGNGSFRRYKSSGYNRDSSQCLHLDAVRLGSAGTGASAKAVPKLLSRPTDGDEHMFDGGYGGGFDVPPGKIGVRSDYVSCMLDFC